MGTHHIKITGQDGQRGAQKDIFAKTVTGQSDITGYADNILRNFEGGKSHYENVRCTIAEMNPATRQWKIIHFRKANEPTWIVPRTIAAVDADGVSDRPPEHGQGNGEVKV
jgi:hypothetical protein